MKTITIDGVEYNLTPKNQNPIMEKSIRLEWGKTAPAKMNWEDAKYWCEEQGDGWRLPTIEELEEANNQKIEDFGRICYWSATAISSPIAHIYSFVLGATSYNLKTNSYSIRCIRNIN